MPCTWNKLNYSILSVFNCFIWFVIVFFLFFFCHNISRKFLVPVLFWYSPNTIVFNSNIVLSSDNSKESLFTPISSPWVSDSPELLTIFFSPSNYWYFMIRSCFSCCVFKDTSCIIMKLLSRGNWTCYRSSLEYFLHHLRFSWNSSPCFNFIYIMFRNRPASFTFSTVTTGDKVRTLKPISPTSCLIKTTGLILDSMLFDPFKCSWWISSVTSIACRLTAD